MTTTLKKMSQKIDNKFFPTVFSKKVTFTFVLVTLVMSFGCQSKNSVKKLTSVDSNTNQLKKPSNSKIETDKLEGVVYRLPRTVVQASVPVKKITKVPGEFVDFAPCFFSNDEVANSTKEKSVQYSIDTPTFSSRGEPDPTETYVVKTKGNYFEAKTVLMEYSPTGLLTKGEAESTDNSLDFTLKAIGTVVGLGVNIAKSGSGLKTLTWNHSGVSREYKLPNLNCAKQGFESHKARLEKDLKDFEATNPAIKNIQLAEARNCLNKANNNPNNPKLPNCTINVTKEDVENLEKLVQLKILEEKIKYIEKSPVLNSTINEKENAEKEKKELENNLSSPDNPFASDDKKPTRFEGRKATIAKINTLDERIANLAEKIKLIKDESSIDEEIGEEVENNYNKAATIFAKLESLQTQRDALISTATNVSPETFKAMVEKTDEAVASYRAVFLGGEAEKLWVGVFEYTPNVTTQTLVFNYSANSGVCTDTGLVKDQNIKVNPKFITTKPCDKSVKITVNQKDGNNGDKNFIGQVQKAVNNTPNQTSGWYYRIPARGNIKLDECAGNACKDENKWKNLGVSELTIAQFGHVVSMPAKTAGKTSTSSIILDEATGALKNFKVSSSPLLDETTLKDAQTAAQTLIEAGDPVAKRERELKLLQLQNQINDERKTLNKTNSPEPSPSPSPEP